MIYSYHNILQVDDESKDIIFSIKKPTIILFTNTYLESLNLWKDISNELRYGIFARY